jgi:hypothetical protein
LAFTGITTPSPTPTPTAAPMPTAVPTQTEAAPTPQATPSATTANQNTDPLTNQNEDEPFKTILLFALGAAVLIEGGLIVFLMRR